LNGWFFQRRNVIHQQSKASHDSSFLFGLQSFTIPPLSFPLPAIRAFGEVGAVREIGAVLRHTPHRSAGGV